VRLNLQVPFLKCYSKYDNKELTTITCLPCIQDWIIRYGEKYNSFSRSPTKCHVTRPNSWARTGRASRRNDLEFSWRSCCGSSRSLSLSQSDCGDVYLWSHPHWPGNIFHAEIEEENTKYRPECIKAVKYPTWYALKIFCWTLFIWAVVSTLPGVSYVTYNFIFVLSSWSQFYTSPSTIYAWSGRKYVCSF
jgi:hypothetical protein